MAEYTKPNFVHIWTLDPLLPLLICPAQPVHPVPIASYGGVQESIELRQWQLGALNLKTINVRPAGVQLRAVSHLQIGYPDFNDHCVVLQSHMKMMRLPTQAPVRYCINLRACVKVSVSSFI